MPYKNKDKRNEYHKQYYLKNKEKIKERKKIYHLKNKEKIIERIKIWKLKNKEKIIERDRQYRLKNKEKIKERERQYRLKNKEKIKERERQYRLKNKEKIKECHKQYRLKNKEKILEQRRQYCLKNKNKRNQYVSARRKYDIHFKMRSNLSRRIREILKGTEKSAPTLKLLGVPNIEFLWQHLEKQFKPGMTKENHGVHGWHIDHIRPCASFDLTKPEEQKKCFHYTNLQPLWATENISKGAKYEME